MSNPKLMSEERNQMKVAVCEYLLSVNRDMDGSFIPPTAIDWLSDKIVDCVLPAFDAQAAEITDIRQEVELREKLLAEWEASFNCVTDKLNVALAERDAARAERTELLRKLSSEVSRVKKSDEEAERLEAELDTARAECERLRSDPEVCEDKLVPDQWRVENFDSEGLCYVAIFSGPEAKERAEQYATKKYPLCSSCREDFDVRDAEIMRLHNACLDVQEGNNLLGKQIARLNEELAGQQRLRDAIARLREALTSISSWLATAVCTEGEDKGVVILSDHGTTHSETLDDGRVVEVYDHEHFSPLGDALIAAWETARAALEKP